MSIATRASWMFLFMLSLSSGPKLALAQSLGPGGVTPAPPCAEQDPAPQDFGGFVLGVQWSGAASTSLPYLSDLGVPYTRTYIKWRTVHPQVTYPTLTMADIQANPALVDEWIADGNWTSTDNNLRALIEAGVTPFPVIGAGWWHSYADIDGEEATPDRLGKEEYIAQLYLHTRAAVERYDGDGIDDAEGIVIKNWQVENELNQAYLTAIWGWRKPAYAEGVTSAWYDFQFLTDLLRALNQAVHDADPSAITTTNLHTDIPAELSAAINLPSWLEAAALWRDDVDVMGFDAYPNYSFPDPINSGFIGERTKAIREATCGKNVILMEVGYPAGPAELGFTEAKQAQFLRDAYDSGRAEGLVGYFHFKLSSTYQHDIEITPEDAQNYEMVNTLFTNERLLPLSMWVVRNADYVADHYFDVVLTVEQYWGLMDTQGNHKPSWEVMEDIIEENAAQALPQSASRGDMR